MVMPWGMLARIRAAASFTTLLGSKGYDLDSHAEARLQSALRDMKRTHDASRQAWILRDALDDVMESLNSDAMPLTSRR